MEKVMPPQEKASLTEPSRNGQPKKMAIFLKSANLQNAAERKWYSEHWKTSVCSSMPSG